MSVGPVLTFVALVLLVLTFFFSLLSSFPIASAVDAAFVNTFFGSDTCAPTTQSVFSIKLASNGECQKTSVGFFARLVCVPVAATGSIPAHNLVSYTTGCDKNDTVHVFSHVRERDCHNHTYAHSDLVITESFQFLCDRTSATNDTIPFPVYFPTVQRARRGHKHV